MNWIAFGLAAGFFFAIYNTFLRLSSDHLHALVGSVSLSAASIVTTLALIFFYRSAGQEIMITSKGIRLACAAGAFSAVASLFYFMMFQKKAPLSLGVTLLSLSTICFSVIIGLLFFGEKLTPVRIAGLVLAGFSLYLLGL